MGAGRDLLKGDMRIAGNDRRFDMLLYSLKPKDADASRADSSPLAAPARGPRAGKLLFLECEQNRSRPVKGTENMQIERAKFRLSGNPAKLERFFYELAEMGIQFEANETFTIAQSDSPIMGALASILSISLFPPA